MGQCCCAGSRLFVQEGIYDEFVKRSAARAKSRVVCDPWEAKCEQGKFLNSLLLDSSCQYLKLLRKVHKSMVHSMKRFWI